MTMPSIQIYVKKDFMYAIPLANVPAGFFVWSDPVKIVRSEDKESFVSGIIQLMRRDDILVSAVSADAESAVLSHSKCKTLRQFAKNCREYSLELAGKSWQITPYKPRSDRGTEEDLDAKIVLDEACSYEQIAEALYDVAAKG